MSLKHRDNITVARPIDDDVETENDTFDGSVSDAFEDGQRYEEITVWNYLNVTMAHQLRGTGTLETFHGASRIEVGGGGREPDYVTEWAAEELWHEHNIDLDRTEEFDIEVVDIESDEVHEL